MVEVATIGRIEKMHPTASIPTHIWLAVLTEVLITAGQTDLGTTISLKKSIVGSGRMIVRENAARMEGKRQSRYLTPTQVLMYRLVDIGDVSCPQSMRMVQSNKAKRTIVEVGTTIHTPNRTSIAVIEMTGSIGAEEKPVVDESNIMAAAMVGSPIGAL